jgi:glutamine amidotransferase
VATTSYGVELPAVVEKGNVFATQFHPEKSGKLGLKLLKNFVDIARE